MVSKFAVIEEITLKSINEPTYEMQKTVMIFVIIFHVNAVGPTQCHDLLNVLVYVVLSAKFNLFKRITISLALHVCLYALKICKYCETLIVT